MSNQALWRLVPLVSGGAIAVITLLTLGGGIVLAPLGTLATALAYRRTHGNIGTTFRLGVVVNVVLAIGFVWSVAILVYDTLVNS